MIRKKILILFTLLSALALGACGGGGGGGGSAGGGGLATGGFTKTIELPDSGNGNWATLFRNGFTGARFQTLLLAQDINGSGSINSLSLKHLADQASNSCPGTTISMAHTTLTSLSNTTFADNVEQGQGSVVDVYGPTTLSIPSGNAGDYFEIPLNGAFYYNGVDNLIVEIATGDCTGTTNLAANAATTPYTALIYSLVGPAATTGTVWNTAANMKLGFAGGDNYLVLGGVTPDTLPFSTNTPHVQHLYLKNEINGSGPITGLAYQMNATSSAATYTVTIRLAHTTLTTLGTTFANNYGSSAPAVVANTVTFSIPVGIPAGEWFWVPLPDSTFIYNGTDNLIVEFDTTVANVDNSLRTLRTGGTVGRRLFNDNNLALTGSLLLSSVPNIKFRFNGGTMDNITGISNYEDFVFNNTNSGKVQYVFRPSELGTSGSITGIACRLSQSNTTTTNYTNTEVVLAHSTTGILSITFTDNVAGGTIVFNGTYTMAAGLLQGDWVEIPFTTPFAYNGTDNLVVQIATDASALHGCDIQFDSTRYAGRRMANTDRTQTTGQTIGITSNYLLSSRFMISK